jgi:hypothetical protein
VLATNKEFLDGYHIYSGLEAKKMLRGKALEDVLDKFEILSSPNLRNMISLFKSSGKGGAYDNIMAMKKYTTIEYIRSNVCLW